MRSLGRRSLKKGLGAGGALPALGLAIGLAMVVSSCATDPAMLSGTPDVTLGETLTKADLLTRMRPVTPEMLRDPAPNDWLQWGRTYDGQDFSPLQKINRDTVKDLAPAWKAPLGDGLSMPTPIVHDGVMFLHTSPDTVIALDAATGAELWKHVYTPVDISSTMKMGVSLSGGYVLVPTSDLHVLALDARTGATVWDHAIEPTPPAVKGTTLGLRSAPFIVGDKVIQGVTTSFVPGGGFIVALDINTGKEVWRFHTIPRPGEPGGESWNGLPIEKRSGGSVWHQGTYDRDLNLIYFGVAPTYDTGPMLKPSGIPGTTRDALYTNSTIALNPDTGKLVWHYQHFSNDQWDLDWVFERQIVTAKVNGSDRKVVMTMGKMGILEAVDAATGAYLFSIDAGTQNIITAIDPATGAKTIDPGRLPDPTRPTVYCPGPSGARSWPPTSFSKNTGLLYVPLTEWCMQMGGKTGSLLSAPGSALSAADHPDAVKDNKMGRLQAMDVSGHKLGWTHDLDAPMSTSALATAGGLVFAGDLDPALKAFDDRDGKLLWSTTLDNSPSSSVITYSVGQTQYVAVVVGMKNNHINDMTRRYAAFRKAHNLPAVASPAGGAAVQVFALPK